MGKSATSERQRNKGIHDMFRGWGRGGLCKGNEIAQRGGRSFDLQAKELGVVWEVVGGLEGRCRVRSFQLAPEPASGACGCALRVHSSSLLSPALLTEVLLSRVILAFCDWCLIPLP